MTDAPIAKLAPEPSTAEDAREMPSPLPAYEAQPASVAPAAQSTRTESPAQPADEPVKTWDAAPAQAESTPPAAPRHEAPAVEQPAVQAVQPEPVSQPAPAPAAPVQRTVVSFGSVDQIPDAEPTRTEPRQRRKYAEAQTSSEPLVAIETSAEKVQPVVVAEEPARRTTPRPRRQRSVSNEPLVFVETKPGEGNAPNP